MKKIVKRIVICLMLFTGFVLANVLTLSSETGLTNKEGVGEGQNRGLRTINFAIASPQVNNESASITTRSVFGQLLKLTVGSTTGTDTDWGLMLEDEHRLQIFSESGLSAADMPFGWAIPLSASLTTPTSTVVGHPVAGELILTVSGPNSLTNIDITLSIMEYWK